MTKLYKITNKDSISGPYGDNPMKWGEKVTHEIKSTLFMKLYYKFGSVLCTKYVIHAYISREMASFIHHIHISYGDDGILWEAEGDIVVRDSFKVGVNSLTTKHIIPLPQYSNRNIFDLLCKILYHFTNDNEVWLDFLEDIKQKNYTDLSVLYDKYEFKLKESTYLRFNILNRICLAIQSLCKYYYIDDKWFYDIMIDQIIRMGDYDYFSDDNALLTIIEETLP